MTAHFSGEPILRWLPDGRCMQLVYDFSYTDATGRVWTVPAGFITDGASIPKALWTVVGGPFEGKYRLAAIVHDFICTFHKTNAERRAGDLLFREMCIVAGCSHDEADVLYRGVSVGSLTDSIGDTIHENPIRPADDPPASGK